MCLRADKAQALHFILLRSLLMPDLPCCAAPSFANGVCHAPGCFAWVLAKHQHVLPRSICMPSSRCQAIQVFEDFFVKCLYTVTAQNRTTTSSLLRLLYG